MKIAALGDSLTYGYGVRRKEVWTTLLAEKLGVPVLNYGVSGDTSAGMLARFPAQVVPQKPTHLFLMGGSNDFIMELNAVQAAANLRTIIFQAAQERMRVLTGIPILPSEDGEQTFLNPREFPRLIEGRAELKRRLEDFATLGLTEIIDFQTIIEGHDEVYLDGLHLNEKGNRLVAEALAAYYEGSGQDA